MMKGTALETFDVGFRGASTVVVMVVASMVVIVNNARTSPMRVKLGMVNVCVIIK